MIDTTVTTVAVAWSDVPTIAGRQFEGDWFTVARDRLEMFDTASYVDDNDHELEGGNFPDGLIEGFHLLSLLDHLVNKVLYVDDPRWSGWNYGLDRVRFVSPATVADRIRIKGAVAEVEPRGEDMLVVLDCTLEAEGRDKPVTVARWRVLWTLMD